MKFNFESHTPKTMNERIEEAIKDLLVAEKDFTSFSHKETIFYIQAKEREFPVGFVPIISHDYQGKTFVVFSKEDDERIGS